MNQRLGGANIGLRVPAFSLYPHLNVLRNSGFPFKCYVSGGGARASGREVARILRISHLLDLSVFGTLPARPAARRAWAGDRVASLRCFLMDEPLRGLYTEMRERDQRTARGLHDRSAPPRLYVTATTKRRGEAMADRIAVMNHGVRRAVREARSTSTTGPALCSSRTSSVRRADELPAVSRRPAAAGGDRLGERRRRHSDRARGASESRSRLLWVGPSMCVSPIGHGAGAGLARYLGTTQS